MQAYRDFTPVLLVKGGAPSWWKRVRCFFFSHRLVDSNKEVRHEKNGKRVELFVSYQACEHCWQRHWYNVSEDQIDDIIHDRDI